MAARFPKFVPILTSYAARVSGRSVPDLLSSSAALARALADTQRIIGHDGVLCLHQPRELALSYIGPGNALYSADDVPRTGTMAIVLDAVQTLRKQFSPNILVLTCFPGPALTLSELKRSASAGAEELADYDYVGDAFVAIVRAAFEAGADSIAVAEEFSAEGRQELTSLYRSTRKLADFYSASFCFFLQPGSEVDDRACEADYIFALPTGNALSLVSAQRGGDAPPSATCCDVAPEVAVEDLQRLSKQAMS
jgi:hypothetical protein